MDQKTLIAALDMSHQRLLDELNAIEKSGQDMRQVLAWRPAPGRAHLGWQFAHCAASHERFLKMRFANEQPDKELVDAFAGGSTPTDANVPSMKQIRELLDTKYAAIKSWIETHPEAMNRELDFGGRKRSVEDTLVLMAWHEAHHHGQIHLTWNLYKVAHQMPV